ncbi:ATP-binding cassette domain-containing protein [bacterium]|nr:ATP-binding cassette domain-containing protein [bacterium]
MNIKIKLSDVCFGYLSKNLILQHLNFTFEANQIYGIIGLSGSGKSTFCRLIANLILPSSGQINYFDELVITNRKKCKKLYYQLNEQIGYVMQFCEKQLLGNSVLEEVLMGYQNFHGKHESDESLAIE